MQISCVQPGCSGNIGPGGFCDSCGTLVRVGTGDQVSPNTPPTSAITHSGADTGTVASPAPPPAAPPPTTAESTASSAAPASTPTSATPVSAPSSASPVSQPSRPTGTQAFSSTTRSRLGGGMKDIPPVPIRDPNEAVLSDPQVPENKRYCGQCHKPVGRTGPDGRPGRVQGFCPHCRHRFSFVPSLQHGDTVVGRYEILGAIAHGGLGWIYLARDKNIGDDVAERWVVLKGLIDSSDPDAIDSAITERRFLAALDHPNIVQIYDFVRHPDPRTNEPLNYIVMEYVPGKSLRDLRRESRDENGQHTPLPLSQVLTYLVEILPALGYLHQQGLLFCDFKPDNVIHVESWLKLIDLGAVRRIDDDESAVFGTPGYSVSDTEIADYGPSVASDLYTVARSAAVLAFDFHGFASDFRNSLPTPHNEPLLARYESFHRLLNRATHPDPTARFTSAEEMREQLVGVRQEVQSLETGYPHGNNSVTFTTEQRAFGAPHPDTGEFTIPTGEDIASSLPVPLVDSDDPCAGFLATLSATDPMEVLYELQNAPEESPEVRLRRVRTNIAYGNYKAATINLDNYAGTGSKDWRITWWRGILALIADDFATARSQFDAVCDHLPGECAATLALAAACELTGDNSHALGIYSRVWQTDRRFVSAGFGQARMLAQQGHFDAAVAALDAVPLASSQYDTAQVSTIGMRLDDHTVRPHIATIRDAADRLSRLTLSARQHHMLNARVLLACLHQVTHGPPGDLAPVLSHQMEEKALRLGLEHTYRQLARTSSARQDRIHFVDEANKIRPWTMV